MLINFVKIERLKNNQPFYWNMPNCEICGSKTNDLFKVSVEGTEMKTCLPCTKFGKVISKIVEKKSEEKKVIIQTKPDTEESIVNNYSSIVRNVREKLCLTQEDFAKKLNERLSVIRSIEQGKLIPALKMAKKLENILGIKLIEKLKEVPENLFFEKSGSATLGDLIKIKKKQ